MDGCRDPDRRHSWQSSGGKLTVRDRQTRARVTRQCSSLVGRLERPYRAQAAIARLRWKAPAALQDHHRADGVRHRGFADPDRDITPVSVAHSEAGLNHRCHVIAARGPRWPTWSSSIQRSIALPHSVACRGASRSERRRSEPLRWVRNRPGHERQTHRPENP